MHILSAPSRHLAFPRNPRRYWADCQNLAPIFPLPLYAYLNSPPHKTGQERWHPKWQTTLQMRVLSQAFQRWAKAKSWYPLAALQRRQAKRRTACRAVRMQHQNDPPSPCQSRYTGRMRASTGTREPQWTPPISAKNGASWSSTTLAASAPWQWRQSSGRPMRFTMQAVAALREKGVVI